MKRGTRVRWMTAAGVNGAGEVVSEELYGHVLVSVDAPLGEEHRIIYCATTWLTETA